MCLIQKQRQKPHCHIGLHFHGSFYWGHCSGSCLLGGLRFSNSDSDFPLPHISQSLFETQEYVILQMKNSKTATQSPECTEMCNRFPPGEMLKQVMRHIFQSCFYLHIRKTNPQMCNVIICLLFFVKIFASQQCRINTDKNTVQGVDSLV